MPTAAWYHVVGQIDPALAERIVALRAAGVDLTARRPPNHGGPGIVFFDAITAELCDFLRDVSATGDARVLGVATAARAIDDSAWTLLDAGASDLIVWNRATDVASEIAARFERWDAVDELLESPLVTDNLIGSGRSWRAVLRHVVEVARFTDASVLILGETGTGKELVARLIHALDPRPRKRELVVLDCTTVVPELSGSEFFGHERGAFTGAAATREGAFALADGGTLFLDEIGDLPLRLQAQLLRAVQERTYKPVGGNSWRATRFRLVCATHRHLADDVAAGSFRADLYYRLGAVICRLPPLRERPEDILTLFRYFVARFSSLPEPPEVAEPVRQMLLQRRYPGNIRELQQLARRTACRHVGSGAITIGDIPHDERPHDAEVPESSLELAIRRELALGAGLKAISRAAAAAAIRVALDDANGNLRAAARRLGVTDRALQLRRAIGPGVHRRRTA
jgi:transcriptional regulator with GAF, ATPase, and Fis domain